MIHLFLKPSTDILTLQLINSNSKQTGKTVYVAHLIPELCPVRGESTPHNLVLFTVVNRKKRMANPSAGSPLTHPHEEKGL